MFLIICLFCKRYNLLGDTSVKETAIERRDTRLEYYYNDAAAVESDKFQGHNYRIEQQ